MAGTINLKIEDYEPPKVKCATCDNGIPLIRGQKFPICDDCLKALREIIKERRKNERPGL